MDREEAAAWLEGFSNTEGYFRLGVPAITNLRLCVHYLLHPEQKELPTGKRKATVLDNNGRQAPRGFK